MLRSNKTKYISANTIEMEHLVLTITSLSNILYNTLYNRLIFYKDLVPNKFDSTETKYVSENKVQIKYHVSIISSFRIFYIILYVII